MGEAGKLESVGRWYVPGMSRCRMGGDWRCGWSVGKVSCRNELQCLGWMGKGRWCGLVVSSKNEPQCMREDSKDLWLGRMVSSRNEP